METMNKIESLGLDAMNLAESKLNLWKLQAVDKSAKFTSAGVYSICLLLIGIFFVLMINIGAALWIGEILGKSYYGFFIVSIFYVILGIILYAFREQLVKTPIVNFFIKSFLD